MGNRREFMVLIFLYQFLEYAIQTVMSASSYEIPLNVHYCSSSVVLVKALDWLQRMCGGHSLV